MASLAPHQYYLCAIPSSTSPRTPLCSAANILSPPPHSEDSAFSGSEWTTVQSYQTAYVYHPQNLLLAYGISIFCTFICVLVGFLALYRNRFKCYTNSFSTVVRTTRDEAFDALVTPVDLNGRDLCIERIGDAKVMLARRRDGAPLSHGFEVCQIDGKSEKESAS
jgi:hypothetical protein